MTDLKMFGSLNHFLCDTRVMLKNTHQIHCRKRSDEYRLFLLCCFIINYINYINYSKFPLTTSKGPMFPCNNPLFRNSHYFLIFSRLWDIECGACLRVLEGHEELVRCIRFDNKRIVSGAYDG